MAVTTFLPMLSTDSLVHAALNFSFFRLLYLVTDKAVGYGDVRLALLIGLYSGSLFESFDALVYVNIFTWINAGLFALVRCIWSELSLKERIPFAPFMYLGLLIAVATSR